MGTVRRASLGLVAFTLLYAEAVFLVSNNQADLELGIRLNLNKIELFVDQP